MKVITKNNYKPSAGEKLTHVNDVDRAGYLSPEIRYRQMQLAGIKLEESKDEYYDYNSEVKDPQYKDKFRAKMDKLEAIDVAKVYSEKLEERSKETRLAKKLIKEYDDIVKRKKMKQEVIKEIQMAKEQEEQGEA